MKIHEIIREDISAEQQLGGEVLETSLVPVLMFLKKRGEDKGLAPKISTDSLIQLVQNAGDTTFDYESLVDAHENNPAVAELIKSFNQDEVILKSADDVDDEDDDSQTADDVQMDPEEVVGGMAKKALNNRS